MVHGGLGLSLTLFDGALPFPSSNGRSENSLASNNRTAPQCLADRGSVGYRVRDCWAISARYGIAD